MRALRPTPATRVASPSHLPLARLALCLDCEACFEIGPSSCPACGSETWCPLARFLELRPGTAGRGPDAGRPSQLIVVARGRPRLYARLRWAFAGNRTVQVILDRRVGERRRVAVPGLPERRRRDRRSGLGERELQGLGWTVVRTG